MQTVNRPPARSTAPTAPSRTTIARVPMIARYGELALAGVTGAVMLLAIALAFYYAPTEAVQGNVQRIEYFHVPMGVVAFLAFFVVFVASALYLWRKDERWDWLARASAEIGVVFTTLVLVTGSLWGRPVWGAWWAWDARMTTTLILWFIYVGYLLLRSYTGRSASGARAAAVLGIIGFVDVPIDYLSVTWWRTLHPGLQVPLGGQAQAPASVVLTLLVALAAFTLLYAYLLVLVYRLQRLQSEALQLRARVELEA